MRTLDVALGPRSYPIHVGAGVLARAGELCAGLPSRRAVIVTNATVAQHWLGALRSSLAGAGFAVDAVLVPDGEAHKSLATLNDVLTRLLELRAERSTTLFALGGGVVGDLAGFAAAVYQRGVPFVQVPTTLLAQVDSSVGGKTAVNHPLGKNMIGAFWQPRAVLADTSCLRTLPPRELSAGLAEVVKVAAIRDAAFFAWLERSVGSLVDGDEEALAHAIVESCRIKAAVVAADERETGERALLNFGHTFGHAIENAAGYGAWLHGEAVAAGMSIAARLSARVCGLPPGDAVRLDALLARARLPLVPPALPLERWLDLMARDKKVEAGRLRFVLLEALGRAVVRGGVAADDLVEALGPQGQAPLPASPGK
ncbi:MAG: 3-dehydroquinate synthase [Betaproteobacteria bacterium]|nr:3-dehydroquinate synthase [Betaproteobacteria bacterium]MDH5287723.1 3-dehydroquinate synthase [Betaproteobacteria bacterium]